jgi:hypothetical protein
MTAYSIALFLHIVGALALFAALGLEGVALLRLRRADTAEQVREWTGVFGLLRRLGPASLGLLLLAGLYMTATTWGGQAWITTAFVSMLLLPVLGAPNGLRVAAIARDVSAERGPLSAGLRARLGNRFLSVSYQVRLALALGIVFLMVVKPDLFGALVTVGVAVLLGLASSLPAWGRDQQQVQAKQASDRL